MAFAMLLDPMRHALLLAALCCACGTQDPRVPRPADPERSALERTASAPVSAPSSSAQNPALVARARELFELALSEGRAHAMLQELCALAPHRLSGSPGAERAVEWGIATMRAIGLANVRTEPIMVPHWVRGNVCEVRVILPGMEEQLDAIALGGSVATPEAGVTTEVVMVRSFEQLRALGSAAAGKIAFFNRPMPRALANTFQAYGATVDQRGSGAVEAGKVGAVGALVRSMTTAIDAFPHTGGMHYDDAVPKVPAIALSTKSAERLRELLEVRPSLTVRIRCNCETLADVASANVVGEIVGSSAPKEIVLVGGHLDAWDVGQGAHDDGAGIAHTLEAARLLLTLGFRPARTIRFILFMNEENGLRGAKGYVEAHQAELSKHVAAIESDRGGFLPLGFTTSFQGADLDELRHSLAPLAEWSMSSLVAGNGGADIGVLAPHGVAMFEILIAPQRYFDHHHCAKDVIESVNERELALGAAGLAYLTAHLATRTAQRASQR